MKNLHRKIGVILLSGLVLAGGSLAVSSSVAHASSKLSFQQQSFLKEINAYGKNGGFEVISYNSKNSQKIQYLDEYDKSFSNANDLYNYLLSRGGDLVPGSSHRAELGGLEVVIKIGKDGIRDVDLDVDLEY